MDSAKQSLLMEAVLDVLNHGYEIAHCAESPANSSFTRARDFRDKLDALGKLYEEAKPKPRPALRRCLCGRRPRYTEEPDTTIICCPDNESPCEFLIESTPERAVRVWNEPD